MSTLKTNNVQVGQSVTATNNFTIYQPSSPDGTVRIGVGNSGATTADIITANSSGNVGIGTSSPFSGSGQVSVSVNGTNAGRVDLYSSGTHRGYLYADSTAVQVGTKTAIPLIYLTNDTERARIDTSGNFLFNSGYGSVATAYGCRAWVNWNGTGTVAIRASGKVSSITDNGTGNYTVNITTAKPDANFRALATSNEEVGVPHYCNQTVPSTTTILIKTYNSSAAASDCTFISVGIFR